MGGVTFTVHGKPEPAGSKRGYKTPAGKVHLADANPNARPWKALIADAALQAMNGNPPARGPLHLELVFRVTRPKFHYRTNGEVRASAPLYPAVRPDVLKLARAVEDACTGIVWVDDAQIVLEILHKVYADDGTRRGVTVHVSELAER